MAQLLCTISDGLRPAEAEVRIEDYQGVPRYLPADRGFLTHVGDKYYLPVALLHVHEPTNTALVALPIETDSGDHRLWVKREHVWQPNGEAS